VRIAVEIPPALRRDVEQGVFYCSESILASRVDREQGRSIELGLADAADAESVAETVRRWVEETVASSLRYEDRTLSQWGETPEFRVRSEDLLASPQLRPMGEGLVAYGPALTRVLRALVQVCEGLGEEVGAEPFTLPVVATLEHMQRCDFLRQFPQLLSFVTHFREDHGVIDAFSGQCRDAGAAEACQPPTDALRPFGRLLRPAVCYHVYPFFENATLSADPYLARAFGDCFRYESRNTSGLDRLFDFRMYEIVALGSEERVRGVRDRMLERVAHAVAGLGLSGRIRAANDPFFLSSSVMKSTFQRAHDLKYELEVPFPNREGHLAIASFNVHRDFFGARFGIRRSDGAVASTGCTAFGVDRMLAALLAHHGLDPGAWPAATRDTLGIR
jgi:seryl-tRNA synthetase